MHITRLGYAGFETPDVEAMVAYYTEVIGLTLVERGSDGRAYLSNAVDHHTIVLSPASQNRLRHIGLQIGGESSLSEVASQLREQGISAQMLSDAQPGIPELLELADPEGNTLHLYAAIAQTNDGFSERGIVPEKLGHIALAVHDPKGMADFYQQVFGFRMSDWIEDFFVFLRCGPDHHTLAFLRSNYQKMHHIAFQLKDWAHVQRACDHLASHGISLLWGPGRHGPGHNIFTYHHDPDQQIVELFTELDLMLDEGLEYFEPRPWHEDRPQRPKIWKDEPLCANQWGLQPSPEFLFQT